MKTAKVFYRDKETTYYFLNYSEKEIGEYLERHPPLSGIGTYSTIIIRFTDEKVWTRYWRVLEMLKRAGKD